MKRDTSLKVGAFLLCAALVAWALPVSAAEQPNIILVMADDLGFGDVGYNGNPIQLTPHLDAMAKEGVRLDRFYAAAPVCSPTRGSCVTGRHPYRYNIPWAGESPLPREEISIAEALKTAGYATGHFGKWHLGSTSRTVKQSYFPDPVDPANYSPPWDHGFDTCFSTVSMMPTFNPYYHVAGEFGTDTYLHVQNKPVELGQRTGGFRWRDHYWTGPGQIVDEWLEGDDSEIIMNRALEFIRSSVEDGTPFLSLVWFHTPHTPVVAGPEDRGLYSEHSLPHQHWHGSISAMDRQVGRLREELHALGIADDTIVWFCSDNGPSYIHDMNSAGPLRGKKATLWEGGIRVPAVVEWPARFKTPRTVDVPISTSDFYPTLLGIVGVNMPNQPPLDGVDVLPILDGEADGRPSPIAFQSPMKGERWEANEGQESLALIDGRYKLASFDGGSTYQLYDLVEDVGEENDIAADHPDRVREMQQHLELWSVSAGRSAKGEDYK